MRRSLFSLFVFLVVPTLVFAGDINTDGKLKSSLASGAPLEVASADMVLNLNADTVDGVHGTEIYTKAEVDALITAAANADPRRAYYMTTTKHDGDEVLSACESGFHMASMFEILDTSNLRYDAARGETRADSGSGPPQGIAAWIRTGYAATTGGPVGIPNCNAWSSDASDHSGTYVGLRNNWDNAPNLISPWGAITAACNVTTSVWCIED